MPAGLLMTIRSLVLVEDVERQMLRLPGVAATGSGSVDGDDVALADRRVGLHRLHPRQRHVAVVDQPLDLRPRVARDLAREDAIEAQAVVLGVDDELDPLLRRPRSREARLSSAVPVSRPRAAATAGSDTTA